MIKVSEAAEQEFVKYFEGKEVRPLRVHLADGGCGGMRLSLALDELRDGDKSFEAGELIFVINEELSEAAGVVSIDMGEYGFSIDSENHVGGDGCASCGPGGCGS